MIRKALTYLTILALTALPVQLISASVEIVGMQMSMSQQMQAGNDCLHEMAAESKTVIENACCDDQKHDCQNCNNCPQAVSVMFSPSHALMTVSLVKAPKVSPGHSNLNGIPQKNLLRPPQV